jgi:hypothetical protein
LVAAASFYYSTISQRIDAEYREAQIRPHLSWGISPYRVYFVNAGLGPAVIKSFGIRVGGKCIDSAKIPASNRIDEGRKMRNALFDAFTTALFSLPLKVSKVQFPQDYMERFGSIPDVGQAIQAKDSLELFVMSDASAKAADEFIAKNYAAESTGAVFDLFAKQVEALGLRITYCSMTQHFCEDSALGGSPC